MRLSEIRTVFLSLKYPKLLIDEAIRKAEAIDIDILRTKAAVRNNEVIPFIVTHNPKNPDVFPLLRNLFDNFSSDEDLSLAFKDSRLIKSYRQPKNLKRLLTSARLHSSKGRVTKCSDKRCMCCSHLITGDCFYFDTVNVNFDIRNQLNCNTRRVIYVMVCNGCKAFYIGQTGDVLRNRTRVHRQHINNPHSAPLPVSRHIANCANHLNVKFSIMPLLVISTNRNIISIENTFIDKYKPLLNNQ